MAAVSLEMADLQQMRLAAKEHHRRKRRLRRYFRSGRDKSSSLEHGSSSLLSSASPVSGADCSISHSPPKLISDSESCDTWTRDFSGLPPPVFRKAGWQSGSQSSSSGSESDEWDSQHCRISARRKRKDHGNRALLKSEVVLQYSRSSLCEWKKWSDVAAAVVLSEKEDGITTGVEADESGDCTDEATERVSAEAQSDCDDTDNHRQHREEDKVKPTSTKKVMNDVSHSSDSEISSPLSEWFSVIRTRGAMKSNALWLLLSQESRLPQSLDDCFELADFAFEQCLLTEHGSDTDRMRSLVMNCEHQRSQTYAEVCRRRRNKRWSASSKHARRLKTEWYHLLSQYCSENRSDIESVIKSCRKLDVLLFTKRKRHSSKDKSVDDVNDAADAKDQASKRVHSQDQHHHQHHHTPNVHASAASSIASVTRSVMVRSRRRRRRRRYFKRCARFRFYVVGSFQSEANRVVDESMGSQLGLGKEGALLAAGRNSSGLADVSALDLTSLVSTYMGPPVLLLDCDSFKNLSIHDQCQKQRDNKQVKAEHNGRHSMGEHDASQSVSDSEMIANDSQGLMNDDMNNTNEREDSKHAESEDQVSCNCPNCQGKKESVLRWDLRNDFFRDNYSATLLANQEDSSSLNCAENDHHNSQSDESDDRRFYYLSGANCMEQDIRSALFVDDAEAYGFDVHFPSKEGQCSDEQKNRQIACKDESLNMGCLLCVDWYLILFIILGIVPAHLDAYFRWYLGQRLHHTMDGSFSVNWQGRHSSLAASAANHHSHHHSDED